MGRIRRTGLLALAISSQALAVPTATWTVDETTIGSIGTRYDAALDPFVGWAASVAVTTDCKGLANYALTLFLQKEGAAVPYTFAQSTAVVLKTTAGYTGPSSLGTNTTPGKLAGIAAGYGTPWAGPPAAIWGVGLAARKPNLGLAPTDLFVLNTGVISTAGLAGGTYTIKLQVDSSFVLKTYKGTTTTILNWDAGLTSLPSETATGVGSQFTFVVPEPTTMVLLALGAVAALKRRR